MAHSRVVDIGLAEALHRLGSSGDADAWSRIVDLVADDIAQVARRLTSDHAVVEDAVQESFLQIRDDAEDFLGEGDHADAVARRWVLRVASTTTLQVLRRSRRSRVRDQRHAHGVTAAFDDGDPGKNIVTSEVVQQVRSELARLPEHQREAIVMRFVAGLSVEQVSVELGIPVGTVKTRVHRGMDRMRSRLERSGATIGLIGLGALLQQLPAQTASSVHAWCRNLLPTHTPRWLWLTASGVACTAIAGVCSYLLMTSHAQAQPLEATPERPYAVTDDWSLYGPVSERPSDRGFVLALTDSPLGVLTAGAFASATTYDVSAQTIAASVLVEIPEHAPFGFFLTAHAQPGPPKLPISRSFMFGYSGAAWLTFDSDFGPDNAGKPNFATIGKVEQYESRPSGYSVLATYPGGDRKLEPGMHRFELVVSRDEIWSRLDGKTVYRGAIEPLDEIRFSLDMIVPRDERDRTGAIRIESVDVGPAERVIRR
jgi:RNA polymerase sigma-70 factor, ECF subfamily